MRTVRCLLWIIVVVEKLNNGRLDGDKRSCTRIDRGEHTALVDNVVCLSGENSFKCRCAQGVWRLRSGPAGNAALDCFARISCLRAKDLREVRVPDDVARTLSSLVKVCAPSAHDRHRLAPRGR